MGGEAEGQGAESRPITSQTNERATARYQLDASLVARPKKNRTRVIGGRIVDLSCAGVSALMAADLPVGEVLELHFKLPYAAAPVLIEAAIRYREGYRYGLEFVHVTASGQAMINRTCAALALLK